MFIRTRCGRVHDLYTIEKGVATPSSFVIRFQIRDKSLAIFQKNQLTKN